MLSVTPNELMELLQNIAPTRPVFIWGPPGIGKSAIVEQYAQKIGLPCVSLLGSQLAPEDLIGVPEIVDGKSRFCPPTSIARDEPYVLFLDELNACTPDVQKAFYSLIHDRRIGEYNMPEGSIVIGAGNRKKDKALARPIASALVNRLIHVELDANAEQWITWGEKNHIHTMVLKYITMRPDHLLATQALDDAPFSTPRSWHMLSDALHCYEGEQLNPELIQVLSSGCLSAKHAGQFAAFGRNWLHPYTPEMILTGEEPIPYDNVEEAHFMLGSVRAYLLEKLPSSQDKLTEETEWLVLKAIELIEKTAEADAELVRYFATPEEEDHLPPWFVEEITKMWSDLLQEPEPEPESPFRRPFGRSGSSSNAPAPARPGSRFGQRSSGSSGNGSSRPGGSRFGGRSNPFNRSANDDDDDDAPVFPPRGGGFSRSSANNDNKKSPFGRSRSRSSKNQKDGD